MRRGYSACFGFHHVLFFPVTESSYSPEVAISLILGQLSLDLLPGIAFNCTSAAELMRWCPNLNFPALRFGWGVCLTSQTRSQSPQIYRSYSNAMTAHQPLQQNCVIQLGDVAYWIRDRAERFYNETSWSQTVLPALVINSLTQGITLAHLETTFSEFARKDDVFSTEFTKSAIVFIQSNSSQPTDLSVLPKDLERFLSARSLTIKLLDHKISPQIPEGPYFISHNILRQAWRLYPDTLDAFVSSIAPTPDGEYRYQPLHASGYNGLHSVVAVPSRLYFQKTEKKPLNGIRISVKDLFHVEGIITTMGSKAYTECYGPQVETSPYLQHLIDLGAIIVGKTKMSAFAGNEVPPDKCIDYFPPWNARGDGYQGPSGSSSGAGSSIAGYEWLDFALASDTTGSMRTPASAHGVWGLRMSWNTVDMEGIVPSVVKFDAIGLMARDPALLREMTDLSATKSPLAKSVIPKQILYAADWFPSKDRGQQKMTEQFLAILEDLAGVPHVKISLSEEWSKTAPEELREKPLREYLAKSANWPNNYDHYHNSDAFRKVYREGFRKGPYVSPTQRKRWENGSKVTKEQREQGLAEIEVFKDWIEQFIFTDTSEEPGSIVLLVPLGRPGANYRDTVPPTSSGPSSTAYTATFFASILGYPQLVIPIGQNPYESRISETIEYAPIVGSLVGTHGSDLTLIDFTVEALRKAGWPIKALTGQYMFELGDNDRHSKISSKTLFEDTLPSTQKAMEHL